MFVLFLQRYGINKLIKCFRYILLRIMQLQLILYQVNISLQIVTCFYYACSANINQYVLCSRCYWSMLCNIIQYKHGSISSERNPDGYRLNKGTTHTHTAVEPACKSLIDQPLVPDQLHTYTWPVLHICMYVCVGSFNVNVFQLIPTDNSLN